MVLLEARRSGECRHIAVEKPAIHDDVPRKPTVAHEHPFKRSDRASRVSGRPGPTKALDQRSA